MKKYMKTNNIYVDDNVMKENSNGAITLGNAMLSFLSGDIALSLSPATLSSSAAEVATAIAADGFSREVEISLVNTKGKTLTMFNGSLPVSIASTTEGNGVADIDSATSLTFSQGKANIVINYTGTWAAEDTCTLTVGDTSSILGYSVANKTSVDTLVA